MTPSTQPPEETFCLTCGPGTVLERHSGAVLHCPGCGTREPVPDFPLFVVTGASGTGKTTITGPLRRALPRCDVFDTDITLRRRSRPASSSAPSPAETAERIATWITRTMDDADT